MNSSWIMTRKNRMRKSGVFSVIVLAIFWVSTAVAQTSDDQQLAPNANISQETKSDPDDSPPSSGELDSQPSELDNKSSKTEPCKNNSNGVANLVIPVIAALLSAILTFFATQHTEKRNWLRVQRSELRSRQFEKITHAASSFSEMISSVQKMEASIRRFRKPSGGSELVTKAVDMQVLSKVSEWSMEIEAHQAALGFSEIELRLVGLPQQLHGKVGAAKTAVESILEKLTEETYGGAVSLETVVSEGLQQAKLLGDEFLELAEAFYEQHDEK